MQEEPMPIRSAIRGVVLVFLLSSFLLGQDSSEHGAAARTDAVQQPHTTGQTSSPQAGDDFAQMRDDLNKMDSLNLNMSSEIEFLHDQNLQILLRTNSQMWTLLIRDLQRQLARQERREAASPPAAKK
jgi:hypothetical protein